MPCLFTLELGILHPGTRAYVSRYETVMRQGRNGLKLSENICSYYGNTTLLGLLQTNRKFLSEIFEDPILFSFPATVRQEWFYSKDATI